MFDKFEISALFFLLLFIIGIPMFCIHMDKASCFAKAQAIDYKADWGFLKGCVLTDKEGRTFLLEQLRELGR